MNGISKTLYEMTHRAVEPARRWPTRRKRRPKRRRTRATHAVTIVNTIRGLSVGLWPGDLAAAELLLERGIASCII